MKESKFPRRRMLGMDLDFLDLCLSFQKVGKCGVGDCTDLCCYQVVVTRPGVDVLVHLIFAVGNDPAVDERRAFRVII